MATIPLNFFRRVSLTLSTSGTPLYTAPFDRAAIILTALASNITGSTQTVTLGISGNNYTETGNEYFDVVRDFEIPAYDTANLAIGKIILGQYDQLIASSGSLSSITLTLSVLEAVNTQ